MISDVRSPNLRLAAARRKEFSAHPRVAGDALCPYRLVACGFNFDAGRSVFPEYLASIGELVIWRYVVAGGILWESGQQQVRLEPGMVLATHQPSPARLVVAADGVFVLWILFEGLPAREYFDQIIARFGPAHALAPTSAPVRLAEELVRAVRANRPRESPALEFLLVRACLPVAEQLASASRPASPAAAPAAGDDAEDASPPIGGAADGEELCPAARVLALVSDPADREAVEGHARAVAAGDPAGRGGASAGAQRGFGPGDCGAGRLRVGPRVHHRLQASLWPDSARLPA
jgi:hypothetical protein